MDKQVKRQVVTALVQAGRKDLAEAMRGMAVAYPQGSISQVTIPLVSLRTDARRVYEAASAAHQYATKHFGPEVHKPLKKTMKHLIDAQTSLKQALREANDALSKTQDAEEINRL